MKGNAIIRRIWDTFYVEMPIKESGSYYTCYEAWVCVITLYMSQFDWVIPPKQSQHPIHCLYKVSQIL